VKKGYTILEVLIAVVLLAIILPGLIRWVTASRQAQVGSYRSEQATEYAQYVLDSLRELPRASRLIKTNEPVVHNGMNYSLTWNYVNAANPYAHPAPGAAFVEVRWKVGNVDRLSRLDGVLP